MNEPPQAGPYVGTAAPTTRGFQVSHRQGPLRRRHQGCRACCTWRCCDRRTRMPQITSVDLVGSPGATGCVRLVLSGDDLAGKIGPIVPNWVIPGDARCRSVRLSRPIAFALSASAWRSSWRRRWHEAYDAVGLIEVEYEVLPAVIDEEAAIRRGRAAAARQRARQYHHASTRYAAAITRRPRARPIRSSAFASSTTA